MRSGSESTHHYHSAYEIYYLSSGECKYFIGDRTFDITAGDLVVIPSGTIHKTNYKSKLHSRMLINFSDEYMPPEIKDAARGIGYIYRNGRTRRAVERIFENIESEYLRADGISEAALFCYTSELLLLVIRNMSENEVKGGEASLVERAIKYMKENYMNDVRLCEVARLLSVSAEHLSREFKRASGFGFCEYLTILRLQNAEFMLKNEPGRSVGAIAYACGFNDSNYFSYKFKQAYGVSPMKIKKSR